VLAAGLAPTTQRTRVIDPHANVPHDGEPTRKTAGEGVNTGEEGDCPPEIVVIQRGGPRPVCPPVG
jgi:hypothetical protein